MATSTLQERMTDQELAAVLWAATDKAAAKELDRDALPTSDSRQVRLMITGEVDGPHDPSIPARHVEGGCRSRASRKRHTRPRDAGRVDPVETERRDAEKRSSRSFPISSLRTAARGLTSHRTWLSLPSRCCGTFDLARRSKFAATFASLTTWLSKPTSLAVQVRRMIDTARGDRVAMIPATATSERAARIGDAAGCCFGGATTAASWGGRFPLS